MAKGSRFVYRGEKRSVEDVARRSKQSGGSYDSYVVNDVSFLKPREGENVVRIMPSTWEDMEKWGNDWSIEVWLHRDVGPDKATYLCLDKMLGKKCPVCEARRVAEDQEEADALKPGWRALAWAIDRDNEKAGPQIWGIPVTVFRDIHARSIDKKTQAVILIDHDEEGYDVIFNKEGTGLKTKYNGLEVSRDATPLHDNEKTQQKWLDYIQARPLPDILQYFDAEHIEKVLFGQKSSKVEESEEGEQSTDRPRHSSRTEPDEEGEAEEDKKPSPRRRVAAGEPEDEGEPEPEPKTSRGRRASSEEEEPEKKEEPPRRSSRREPEPEEEPEGDVSAQARRGLQRLKDRRG